MLTCTFVSQALAGMAVLFTDWQNIRGKRATWQSIDVSICAKALVEALPNSTKVALAAGTLQLKSFFSFKSDEQDNACVAPCKADIETNAHWIRVAVSVLHIRFSSYLILIVHLFAILPSDFYIFIVCIYNVSDILYVILYVCVYIYI